MAETRGTSTFPQVHRVVTSLQVLFVHTMGGLDCSVIIFWYGIHQEERHAYIMTMAARFIISSMRMYIN